MSLKRAPRPSPKRPAKAVGEPRISWTRRALTALEAIGDHLARDNPGGAERWVMKLLEAAERAAATPRAGRRVWELGRDDVREVFVRTYRIVYRTGRARIEVLTVFEGHRRFDMDVVSAKGRD